MPFVQLNGHRLAVLIVIAVLSAGLMSQTQTGTPSLRTQAQPAEGPGYLESERAVASLAVGGGPAGGKTVSCTGSAPAQLDCEVVAGTAADSPDPTSYWTNLTGGLAPPSRDWASMTYDAADGYVLLFGGQSASATVLNDTWTFRGGVWQNITSTAGAAPAARMGMAMTYDAADGYVLAFGGMVATSCSKSNSGADCNDTWTFKGGKWNQLSVDHSPPVSALGEMVYDAADAYVVLFGGFSGAGTWTFHAGVWTQLVENGNNSTPIPGPSNRIEFGMTYDAQDGYVLLFGGYEPNNQYFGDTWKFVHGNWTNITANSTVSPSPREGLDMSYDDATGSVILFGGYNSSSVVVNDTWSFSDGNWTELTTATAPPATYGGGLVNDSADGVLVHFGGSNQSGAGGNLNQTWIWGTSPVLGALKISVSPAVPLPGSPATFTSSVLGGVPPFTYAWNFGDGNTSTATSPTHTYSTIGHYLVTLWLNDSAGHSSYAALQVSVYVPLEVSSLQASPNPAILDQDVNFTALATGGTPPYTYAWNFGDGATGGNLSNITHIYTTDGPFEAEVSVTDSLGGYARSYLNVSIAFVALAEAIVSTGGHPYDVSFIGQAQGGTAPYSFVWDFGDGTPSSALQDPTHDYGASGKYLVVLTISDANGDHATRSLTVQVGTLATNGLSPSTWVDVLAVAGGAFAVIAVVWGVGKNRRRTRIEEGNRWVEELTSEDESTSRPPGP